MNQVQRLALAIYAPVFVLTQLLVWFVFAPFLAKAFGWNGHTTAWLLLALSSLAGAWNARSISKNEDPLARLGKVISARPNSGSRMLRESTPASLGIDPGPATSEPEKSRGPVVPR